MDKSWLQTRVTILEVEEKLAESTSEAFLIKYAEFMKVLREGDELWYFTSPPETWSKKMMSGRAGYAILREKEIIYTLVTLMN